MEESNFWLRGVILRPAPKHEMEIASSTGAQSQVDLEGSNGEMNRGGGEQLLVEGSGLRWRAEITGGGPTGGEQ